MKRSYGTLTGNTTITVSLSNDQDLQLLLIQGGTGSYTVTWSGIDKWFTPSGSAPTLQTAVGASDVVQAWRANGVNYAIHIGDSGATGTTGSAGPAGLNWRRAWSSANSYSAGPPADAVYYNGSSYIALQASSSTNSQQPDIAPSYWGALASGASGSSGGGGAESVDNFTRADNSNISTNAPFAYTINAGTAEILSNLCHDTNSAGTHLYVRSTGAVPTSADQHCQVTLGQITTNGTDNVQWGPTCRMDASGAVTRYEVDLRVGAGPIWTLRLHSLVAGVDNIIGSQVLAAPVAGDTIKLTCTGTTIAAFYNGVQKISVTDTAVDGTSVGGKQCGFHMLRATASVNVSLAELRYGS